ncbi:hypothetical protein BGZ46_002229 [Entomortierella lignicola]|nr:hypothetical protein BGZ46_002229 [Entomortierella lignicola]
MASSEPTKQPHVLISGAGIAGLILALTLEKANISYEIFEKAKELKPLGAVMSLNPTVFPVFEQLGIYEDFLKISRPVLHAVIRDENTDLLASLAIENSKELLGYDCAVCARPALYEMLLARVPAQKVHLGKKIESFLQDTEGVVARLQDGTTVHGDILVGADGAYSKVREHLYKQLQDQGKLPKADSEPISRGFVCMVGLTNPLDSEKFPDLKDQVSHSDTMVGSDSSFSWGALTLPGNIVSWGVIVQLNAETAKYENFRDPEWGAEANSQLIKDVSQFKTRYGTIGSLIESTPKDYISRVFLEDKLFETWTHSRVALIGDACHKVNPSAGLGAVNAIQDAVVLANSIYEMSSTSQDNIVKALKEYREQRFEEAKTQYETSKFAAKILYGHTYFERAFRYVLINYMPKPVQTYNFLKSMAYRPQIAFLPQTPNRGTATALPQKPSVKYAAKQANVSAV